jgi:hypothetical protein
MSIEEELQSLLSNHDGLTAIVGDRIYPGGKAPQTITPPFLVHMKISDVREYSHQGFSGLSRMRIQVSCFAGMYVTVKTMAAMVTDIMESWSAAKVQAVFREDEQDMYDETTAIFHIPLDFIVWYG